MSIPTYERLDTIKLTNIFYSGGVASYPKSANLTVYASDGTVIYRDVSGHKTGTVGEYYYYISTSAVSPLGIYLAYWRGMMGMGNWGYLPDTNMEQFLITTIG